MLQKAWKIWKRFGELVGNLLARLVLTVFYFTLFVPFAIGLRLFGDPLQIKRVPALSWQGRETPVDDLTSARKQA